MVVYSFFIFDRHTECVYNKQWLGTPAITTTDPAAAAANPSPPPPASAPAATKPAPNIYGASKSARSRDDAKLVFGTVFSLRNMVRKLGGDDDAFISYRTGQYRLHYYETPSSMRFVMLTDTATLSMRNVLHQIYINLWVEYVVKNPLSPVEHKGGEGVKNEMFELGLDQFIRGLQ